MGAAADYCTEPPTFLVIASSVLLISSTARREDRTRGC